MADYGSFLYNSLAGVGDVIRDNRRTARENVVNDRNYARMLGLDQYQQQQDTLSNARADRGLDIQERNAARGPDLPSTYQEYLLAQGDPKYGGYLNSRDRKGLSVTEKKEVFESEDELANIDATVKILGQAKELNPKTFEGVGAGVRGTLGAKLPDWMVPDSVADPKGGLATNEWQNVMSMEAIKTMAGTLKGATTDFELNKFVEILADPSTPREVRARVIDRMTQLATRKRQILNERMSGVRDQTYFQPGGGAPGAQTPDNIEAIEGDVDPQALIQQAQEAIDAGADPEAVRARLQEMGVDLR